MKQKKVTIVILSIVLLSAALLIRAFLLPRKLPGRQADNMLPENELPSEAETENENEIIWHDDEFKDLVCQQLQTADEQLTYEDLKNCTELQISGSTIKTIADLTYFSNLEILYLNNVTISDYSQIRALPALKELFIVECELADISFLEGLSNLTHLSLYGNNISDITSLAEMTDLVELSLSFNPGIADISVLGRLTKLEDLGIAACSISDLSPLASITALRNVNFNANEISDLSPLTEFTELETIGGAFNQISDLSPLSNMAKLTNVSLSYNEISDISPLKNAVDIQWLSFDNNQVTDLAPLTDMKQLFYLNGRQNPIEDIRPVLYVPDLQIGNYATPYPVDMDLLAQNQVLGEQLLNEYYGDDNAEYEDLQTGSLNGDEYDDLVIVAHVKNDDETEVGQARNLYIFTGNADGSYTPLQVLPTAGVNDGGIYGDPYQGVQMADGMLLVYTYGGSSRRWGHREVYRYDENQLVPTMVTTISSVVWSGHYEVSHYDYENNWQQACMYYGSLERKMEGFLYKDLSLDEEMKSDNIYPKLPGIDSDYDILENISTSDEDGEAIIEIVFDSYFDKGEIKVIPYTEQTKSSYDQLTGVKVPSFYYETQWQGIPGILVYQGINENEKGILIHRICFYGIEEDRNITVMFYYNEGNRKIEVKE